MKKDHKCFGKLTAIGFILIIVALFMFCSKSHATGTRSPLLPSVDQTQNQLQLQNQVATQKTINTAALSTIVTNNEKRRPVNSAFGTSAYSNNPCHGSSGGGATGSRFSFSIGTTWQDKDCTFAKLADDFYRMGYKADAIVTLCQAPSASEAPTCKAIYSQEYVPLPDWKEEEER